jgi:hypothetical protein
LFPIRNLVTKCDLRCFVVLAGILPAIRYVPTCGSNRETVNERFKNWAILATPYHHKLLKHQTVFGAIVVLTQLSLAEDPLFQVEYND